MKKLLIITLVLAPVLATAQETATVNVTTAIQGNFTLTPTNLAFGNVQQEEAVTITIADVKTNAGNAATRGAVAISGTTADVIYTVTGTNLNATNGTTLTLPKTGGSGSETSLVVTLTYGRNTGSPVAYTPGFATTGTTDSERSLVIGGTFTAAAGTSGNTYSSALTVTVIYI
jgi:hypothetical protein